VTAKQLGAGVHFRLFLVPLKFGNFGKFNTGLDVS
jgi:hypothetical protein